MSDVFCPKPDPKHYPLEGRDIAGEVLEAEKAKYDPRAAQEADYQRKRDEWHSKPRLVLVPEGWSGELPDSIPMLESRVVELGDNPQSAKPVLERFFATNPDVAPHAADIFAEVRKLTAQSPGTDASTIFNLAVYKTCKARGISVAKPQSPVHVPTMAEIRDEEVARLQAERKKLLSDPGPDTTSLVAALRNR